MDSLIKILETFNITKDRNVFDDDLELLTSKFESTIIEDEYTDFKSNFSKLRYLKSLIDVIPISQNFLRNHEAFMKQIDTVNRRYLQLVDWCYEDYDGKFIKCEEIKILLEASLSVGESMEKMNYVLEAYSLLIPIVEYVSKEKFVEIIHDSEFLNKFPPKKKKKCS
jgi:hypothetical protein